jgi:hypothetical protein
MIGLPQSENLAETDYLSELKSGIRHPKRTYTTITALGQVIGLYRTRTKIRTSENGPGTGLILKGGLPLIFICRLTMWCRSSDAKTGYLCRYRTLLEDVFAETICADLNVSWGAEGGRCGPYLASRALIRGTTTDHPELRTGNYVEWV